MSKVVISANNLTNVFAGKEVITCILAVWAVRSVFHQIENMEV